MWQFHEIDIRKIVDYEETYESRNVHYHLLYSAFMHFIHSFLFDLGESLSNKTSCASVNSELITL